jgi:hypothetical protein
VKVTVKAYILFHPCFLHVSLIVDQSSANNTVMAKELWSGRQGFQHWVRWCFNHQVFQMTMKWAHPFYASCRKEKKKCICVCIKSTNVHLFHFFFRMVCNRKTLQRQNMFLLKRQHQRVDNFAVKCMDSSPSHFLSILFPAYDKDSNMYVNFTRIILTTVVRWQCDHDDNEYVNLVWFTLTIVTRHIYTTLWYDVIFIYLFQHTRSLVHGVSELFLTVYYIFIYVEFHSSLGVGT